MKKNNPFEMSSIKPIDDSMLPYGSYVITDLIGKSDEETIQNISFVLEKLVKQMRSAQKEYGITPDTDSLQFHITINPDYPVRRLEPNSTVAIKYYARRIPNEWETGGESGGKKD